MVRKNTKIIMLLASALILQTAARQVAGFGQWYAVSVYPVLVSLLGRFCSFFPFSVVEIGLYLLLAGICVFVYRQRRRPAEAARGLLTVGAGLFFLYTVNCGINYYRQPFSSYLELELRESSQEELQALCVYLTGQVNERAGSAGVRETGADYQKAGRVAMAALGDQYPQLSGYYPRPKAVLVSEILSVQQLCGVYSPFTVEANYNRDMPAYNIPHTICHELSHLKGFMREDEANFIGYLACIGSERESFQYSGYLMGWIYATNQLAQTDMDAYLELYASLDPLAAEDLRENSLFWDQYEGAVAEAANQVNDVYLKANSQTDGVKSYGRAVDLMLAYYRENNALCSQ